MHLLAGFALLPVVLASVLTSYNAANGDQTSKLGLENLTGWNRQEWPDGKADNSSLFFTTGKDPKGVPAAHVHRSPHFVRAEYHSLNKQTLQDMTYFIGYHVSFESVDVSTKVFQWKEFERTDLANIPFHLQFDKDADSDEPHTLSLHAAPNANGDGGATVWTKTLVMGTAYRFGIVVNTSRINGWIQLYFNGALATMTDPRDGSHTQKLSGNFFPGRADPKFGLYDGHDLETLAIDSYIYNVVIGTTLADIKTVAGIA